MPTTSKAFYLSKTFWVNLLAMVAIIVQSQTGFVMDESIQLALLAIINGVLRAVTSEAIEWKGSSQGKGSPQ